MLIFGHVLSKFPQNFYFPGTMLGTGIIYKRAARYLLCPQSSKGAKEIAINYKKWWCLNPGSSENLSTKIVFLKVKETDLSDVLTFKFPKYWSFDWIVSLRKMLADIFCKVPEGKYFRLCGPCSLWSRFSALWGSSIGNM